MSSNEAALKHVRDAIRRSLAQAQRRSTRQPPRAVFELGHTDFKAAAARMRRGRAALRQAMTYTVPPEAAAHDGTRRAALGARLRPIVAGERHVLAVAESTRIRSAVFDIPPLPLDDTANALALKALKLIGASTERWHVSAVPLADGAGGARPYLVAALPQDALEELAHVWHAAGTCPRWVTLPALLYQNLMALQVPAASDNPEDPSDAAVWVAVEIRRDATTVYVYCNGRLEYSRHFQIGGDAMTAALTDVVATPAGFVELTTEEAERLKRAVGFPEHVAEAPADDTGRLSVEQIRMMLEPKLKALVFELRNSIRFYQQKSGRRRIQRLVLTGGGSLLKGLDAYVFEQLKIRPHRFSAGDFPLQLEAGAAQACELAVHAPHLLAALASPPPALNLAPPSVRWDRVLRVPCRIAAAAALLCTLTFAGVGAAMHRALAAQPRLTATVAQSSAYLERIEDLDRTTASLKADMNALSAAVGRSIPVAELLADMSRRIPPQAVLTSMTIVNEHAAHTVSIQGRLTLPDAADMQPAVLLTEAFAASPFVKDVHLSALTRDHGPEGHTFRFAVTLTPHVWAPETRP